MKWHWQYVIPIIMLASSIDAVIMPTLEGFGVRGWWLFWITSTLATFKLYSWYFFWIWFRKTAIPELVRYKMTRSQDIREGVALGREIKSELQRRGLTERLADFCHSLYQKYTDKDSKLVKRVKNWGHFGLMVLGVLPSSASRAVGVTVCATVGWHRGMLSLSLGNICHIGYMVGIWDVVFSFFRT